MRRVREWLSRGWEDLIVDTSTMPGRLRDELSIIQFDRLRQRIPILYVVLAMISVGAGLASKGDFPIALQIAMPALMLVASIWRYFAWANQVLAAVTLWAITIYLLKEKKPYIITLLPALFMTMVCVTYIFIAQEGFALNQLWSYIIGGFTSSLCLLTFIFYLKKHKNKVKTQ